MALKATMTFVIISLGEFSLSVASTEGFFLDRIACLLHDACLGRMFL
jgi:hypothetical protein